jgi:transcription elongation factor Elf1
MGKQTYPYNKCPICGKRKMDVVEIKKENGKQVKILQCLIEKCGYKYKLRNWTSLNKPARTMQGR